MSVRFLVISLFFLLPEYSLSQSLLVNGGFEDENICSEYQVNCAPEAWISNTSGFNNYFKDANRAYEGEHCMAIEAGNSTHPFQRTFLRSQLLCGLRKGNQYKLEFYIKSVHFNLLDSVGVYFGPIDPLLERKPVHRLAPSLFLIDNPSNHFKKDSSWQKAELIYTANGNESYITMANFSHNDIIGQTGIRLESHFFIFLDEVSLIPVNPDEHLCADWKQVKESIYDEDERHEFLQKAIRFRMTYPKPVHLTPNTILVADTLVLPDVLFATGKANLQPGSFHLLDSILFRLKNKQVDSLIVEGHTDSIGSAVSNIKLSLDRANAVADYFLSKIPVVAEKVTRKGMGSLKPVASNKTASGRQQNRRVEIYFYIRE